MVQRMAYTQLGFLGEKIIKLGTLASDLVGKPAGSLELGEFRS